VSPFRIRPTVWWRKPEGPRKGNMSVKESHAHFSGRWRETRLR
jgi:hypothetical protein